MPQLTLNDLEDLALGCAVLGSGGGGDPTNDLLMAQYQLEKHGPVQILDVEDLKNDDFVVPLAFMGAPLVAIEKIPSGREFMHLIPLIEKHFGKKPTALMAAEIGGGNAFTPVIASCILRLPILDADTIGRAFPELQMSVCSLHGKHESLAFLCDALGNSTIINAVDCFWMEKLSRHLTVAMGSSAALAIYMMSGDLAKKTVVSGTLSKAIQIGKKLKNPLIGLKGILNEEKGLLIGSGKITDIDQVVSEGFLKGSLQVENFSEIFKIEYQNEYLIVKKNTDILATTPNIIMLLEQETAQPITSESLKHGLKVDIIALPSPKIWQSDAGLKLVGPRYFGYETDYKGINR